MSEMNVRKSLSEQIARASSNKTSEQASQSEAADRKSLSERIAQANAARIDGTSKFRIFTRITLPLISPMIFYLVITGFIGAFKAYSDAVALFGTDLNAAEMNTIVGYIYDMLYGNSGGYPSFASAAAIILFAIVLTITCINLIISKKHVHY